MSKEQFIDVDEYGNKLYFADRKMTIFHREDGPAIEWYDGSKEWFLNDKRHREDGPAIEKANGDKWWYLNDEKLTEEEFNARMNSVTELTLNELAEKLRILDEIAEKLRILDEIAAKFGVNVSKLKIKK